MGARIHDTRNHIVSNSACVCMQFDVRCGRHLVDLFGNADKVGGRTKAHGGIR